MGTPLFLSPLLWVLKVIIDYGFAFVNYGNEIESKGVQFPGRGAPNKIIGAEICSRP